MTTIGQLLRGILFAAALGGGAGSGLGAPLELISTPFEERPSSFGDSAALELSADGKWAVFTSNGNGLVTNDNNGFTLDVFLRNLETGETTLVSGDNGSTGVSGNGHSYATTISSDGRWILFETEADNLLEGDDNEGTDVVLYDRTTGELTAISATTNGVAAGSSGAVGMTANGQFILFESDAQGFSPLDTNESVDLYLLERETGTMKLVTVDSNNTAAAVAQFPSLLLGASEASVSEDGRFVAFISYSTNHVHGLPANARPQIYLRDMMLERTRWLTAGENETASDIVFSPVVSSDGAIVVFISADLDSAGTPGGGDATLYIFNTATAVRTRAAGAPVDAFSLSGDGQHIAYSASNQVYVLTVATGEERIVSATPGGAPGNDISGEPAISSDGRYVVFNSVSTNLGANLGANVTGEFFQTYQFDQQTGAVKLLSAGTNGAPANADTLFPVISADGSKAGFMSYASNLATNDNILANDLFLVSTTGPGPVALVSAAHPAALLATAAGMSSLERQGLSLDGRRLVFLSHAADIVPNDTNGKRDIFLRDLPAGTTRLISGDSNGIPFNGTSSLVGTSLDGNIIAFLVTTEVDGTNYSSAYYHRVSAGTNTLASILPEGGARTVSEAILSPNGRYLAFRENNSSGSPLFIRDLESAVTTQLQGLVLNGTMLVAFSPDGRFLVTRINPSSVEIREWQINRTVPSDFPLEASITPAFAISEATAVVGLRTSSSGPGTVLTLFSLDGARTNQVIATNASFPAISADGSTVAYQLDPAPFSSVFNFYTYDVASGLAAPLKSAGSNAPVRLRATPGLSADGRFIAFASTNAFAAEGDENDFNDVFVYDRVLNTVRLVSEDPAGGEGEFGSSSPFISADGRVVAFESAADDLVANDRNLSSDIFVARFDAVDTDADGLEDGLEIIHFGGLEAAAEGDADNDGVSNRNELLARTDPNSAASRFVAGSDVDLESGTVILSSAAAVGRAYQLEYRANLGAGEWQNVGQPVVAFSTEVAFEAPVDFGANRFFRIRAL